MNINIFDTYTLLAMAETIKPKQSFFRDRYFPTSRKDMFSTEKVLAEYKNGDRKIAPIVSPRAGDIAIDREGYTMSEFAPPFIAPSRLLSLDDLKKRGYGEALYAGSDEAERAAKLTREDLIDLDDAITLREEWMAAETMINNACTMQEFIDEKTAGEKLYVKFFDKKSDHTYGVTNKWNAKDGNAFADIKAMARRLTDRGLAAADLVLGSDAYDALLSLESVQRMLDRNSGIAFGKVEEELSKYMGVVYGGTLNFGGHRLNLICVDETYIDETGATKKYFPTTAAMVTAPGCGRMVYGGVTQIDFGENEYTTHSGKRVPKFTVYQDKDIRKLRVAARPLAIPKNASPYIFAESVIS